ncbi:hypothetical protein PHLCEN_2v1897 [Hermanssonia centrifuga]|uniref:Uncharacterized protein n=1 Tax=Hermanssonia centrifuga TaxID=98765 RepID=A0A2R6RVJ2_9APHY|nr:hypothetical protein PHLCEN_2v1897 [Hermanssonia centrifuga]
MRPHYLGPLIIILENRGGAYVLCKLNGTVFGRPIAAFCVVPYKARTSIPLSDNFTNKEYLKKMQDSKSQGDNKEGTLEEEESKSEAEEDDREDLPVP